MNFENLKFEKVRPWILGVLTLAICNSSFAAHAELNFSRVELRKAIQQIVTGTIVDEQGMPLPGVTVQLKENLDVYAVTDFDGNFSISLPEVSGILVIQSIGFKSQEISVSSENSPISITMETEVSTLEEVVVVGYGTMKKGDLTGSIGTVSGERVSERNVVQVSQALQGTVPGLTVTRNTGAPGTGSTLRIRGVTTIGQSDPLILIDGVQASSIDDVHPSDIASISVLKDASSASIYGSKAAAGVVLITTKRASEGRLSMDLNFSHGIERPTEMPEFADAVRYMKMVNELQWNDVNNPEGEDYPIYNRELIENYANLHGENPDQYPDTRWKDLLIKDHAMKRSYQLSVSGGSEKVQSRFSLGYDEVEGLYAGKDYKRLTARINNSIQLTDYLKSSVDVFGKRSIIDNPSQSPMTHAYRSAPVYAAVWSNGEMAPGKSGNNIYAQLLNGGFDDRWYNEFGGRISLEFTPLQDLKITGVVAPSMNFNKTKEFRKMVEYTEYDNPGVPAGTTAWGGSTSLTETRIDSYNVTSQLFLNYDKSFGDHNFDLMGGFEHYYYFYESVRAGSDNLTLDSFPYLDLGNANFLSNGGTAFENASTSFFGRINYNYKRKYLLQANIRADGSSRFHKDYRWGTFPSFSAGWVVSEEDFFNNNGAVSYFKLRGSWGALGNERIGNYPYQATINFANALLYQGNDIISAQTAAQQAYALRDISWETTESWNFGMDAAFLDSRLNLNLDVYKKKTKDMLLALQIPGFMGYGNPDQNAGVMTTNGWEALVNWNDQKGDFRYSVSFNVSDAKTVIDNLAGIQFLGDKVKMEGTQFDEWFGYKSKGIYQTQEEVDNSPVLNAGLAPGDIQYEDISGPDGRPDGIISEYDKVPLGGSLPRYTYGGNFELAYKNFDFSLSFQGVGQQKSKLTSNMVQPFLGSWGNMPMEIDGRYWSMYNTPQENLAATYPRLSNRFIGNNYAMSDFWLINGAYFRIKNVVLGYSLPQDISQKVRLKGVRVYVSATDPLSIDHFPDGWDPEVSNTGHPITSTYNLGISLKL